MKKLLLLTLLCASTYGVYAQTEFQVGEVTALNLGDGRILFRELKSETPLQGEHRLIDGYHSEYILAEFAAGLYNGKYEHYRNNRLIEEGTYKEGRKNGIFTEYYSDGKTAKSTTPLAEGKVDGVVKSYYTDGSLEREKGYKNGLEEGSERYFKHGETEPKIDHYYVEGKMDGRQLTRVSSNIGDYTEVKYFATGVLSGKFEQTWESGEVKISGLYKDGRKEGVWFEGTESGILIREENYKDDKLNGVSKTFFTDGTVEKTTTWNYGKKEGLERKYRYGGGIASEYIYGNDDRKGSYKLYYEDGTLREEGRFEQGNDVYRKEYYPNGQLRRIEERPVGSGSWTTLESYNTDGSRE